MFAEGDPFGTTPATFETLLSGFQSDAHLNPRLGEGQELKYRMAFFPARGLGVGLGEGLMAPLYVTGEVKRWDAAIFVQSIRNKCYWTNIALNKVISFQLHSGN